MTDWNKDDTITILMSEFQYLHKQEDKLLALEAAGVDNWDGYDDAMENLNDD